MINAIKNNQKGIQNRGLNITRILFIIIFLLSLFICIKSFITTYNIEQWSNYVWQMFTMERSIIEQRNPDTFYTVRLNGIQQQWKFIRYVSVGLIIFSCYGVFLTSKNEKVTLDTLFSDNKSNLNLRVIIASICTAIVFLFKLVSYTMIPDLALYGGKWDNINIFMTALVTIALILLIPVFVHGSRIHRFLATIVAFPAAYMAYESWKTIIFKYVLCVD